MGNDGCNNSQENGNPKADSRQRLPRKPPEKARVSAHRSPSLVMPAMRTMIVGSVRMGRSVAATAAEYNVTQACVLELVLRATVRDLDTRLGRLEDVTLTPPPRFFPRAA